MIRCFFLILLKEEKDSFEIVSCEPDDILTILYTPRTTGNLSGAMLTHNNYCQQADLNACSSLHINDQDPMLIAAPPAIYFCFYCSGSNV